jgi:hypothetical protein
MQKMISQIVAATHDFESVNALKGVYRCRTCGLEALPWPHAPRFLGEEISCDEFVARLADARAWSTSLASFGPVASQNLVPVEIIDLFALWVVQQVREAFPFDTAPKHFIFDRDSIFSTDVVRAVRNLGTKPTRTSCRSPWQNGTAERCVGNACRVRRALSRRPDALRAGQGDAGATCCAAEDVAEGEGDRVGGLSHRYEWREAA